jgi:hypothetical protein
MHYQIVGNAINMDFLFIVLKRDDSKMKFTISYKTSELYILLWSLLNFFILLFSAYVVKKMVATLEIELKK